MTLISLAISVAFVYSLAGDLVLVRPGASVPADGEVEETEQGFEKVVFPDDDYCLEKSSIMEYNCISSALTIW